MEAGATPERHPVRFVSWRAGPNSSGPGTGGLERGGLGWTVCRWQGADPGLAGQKRPPLRPERGGENPLREVGDAP